MQTQERCQPIITGDYKLIHGDCVEEMEDLRDNSIDMAVFSPPFASLYSYTSELGDMGNSGDRDQEFSMHFRFFVKRLFEVMKPGRNVCLHLAQLAAFKIIHGHMGLRDFRGQVIAMCEEAGFYYYGEAAISKNPQAQAIRTKSHALMFKSLEKDSLICRPGLNDYLLIFKKPGESVVPVKPECSREDWIKWASGVWLDIDETDVLGGLREAKAAEDEKHICPLQLPLIERCIRLWSNRGEVVFSPFMGIGSEGVMAMRLGRNFVGIELKREYFETAAKNIGSECKQLGLAI